MNSTKKLDINRITEELNKKEVAINNAERARIQAETKREAFKQQYAELNNELKKLGVEPKTANDFLIKISEEINELLKELDFLIPKGF